MDKKTVLVIGASGVGKSTLIKSIYGAKQLDSPPTGYGPEITKKMELYETEPFYLIDSVGFANGFIGHQKVLRQVNNWKKKALKTQREERLVDLIWYCVDGTAKRLFSQTINHVVKVCNMWKDVPVIIVITKSYSKDEVQENVEMIQEAVSRSKGINLKKIVPVVADEFPINREAGMIVCPFGVSELIEESIRIADIGSEAKKQLISDYIKNQKRAQSNAMIAAVSAAAVAIGAVPLPVPDAAPLAVIQGGMINGIARVYRIENDTSKKISSILIELGAVNLAAKTTLAFIKGIPGVNIAGTVLNAAVAGGFTITLGEVSMIIMEMISDGKIDAKDIDSIKKMAEQLINEKLKPILESLLPSLSDGTGIKGLSDSVSRWSKKNV